MSTQVIPRRGRAAVDGVRGDRNPRQPRHCRVGRRHGDLHPGRRVHRPGRSSHVFVSALPPQEVAMEC